MYEIGNFSAQIILTIASTTVIPCTLLLTKYSDHESEVSGGIRKKTRELITAREGTQ